MLDPLDAVVAAPEHHKLLLENDDFRVLETLILPGDETKVHTHKWGGYLYILSWSDFIRYDGDGNIVLESRDIPVPPAPGTAILAPPLAPHSLRNVGQSNIHVILTEIKNPAATLNSAHLPLPAARKAESV